MRIWQMLLSGILLGVSLKRCTCPLVKLGIALEVIYFRLLTSLSQRAMQVAEALYRFWEDRYPYIQNLMTLVNEVGWFAGLFNRPIRDHSSFFLTAQDYMKLDKITTSVYNQSLKKKHRITLFVP